MLEISLGLFSRNKGTSPTGSSVNPAKLLCRDNTPIINSLSSCYRARNRRHPRHHPLVLIIRFLVTRLSLVPTFELQKQRSRLQRLLHGSTQHSHFYTINHPSYFSNNNCPCYSVTSFGFIHPFNYCCFTVIIFNRNKEDIASSS